MCEQSWLARTSESAMARRKVADREIVSIWWDAGTLQDLTTWKNDRVCTDAIRDVPFLASLIPDRAARPLPHRVQGSRNRSARRPDDSSRPTHVHQPRIGGGGRWPRCAMPQGTLTSASRAAICMLLSMTRRRMAICFGSDQAIDQPLVLQHRSCVAGNFQPQRPTARFPLDRMTSI